MGVSLEGRVPFLDHRFVELALSIPASLKTKHGVLKYILKKAVRGVIPDELITRKKQGFGVPVYEWYGDKLGTLALDEVRQFCDETDLLDSSQATEAVQTRGGLRTWCLLNLALWWKQFLSPRRADVQQPPLTARESAVNPAR
jgi:asparagine synthase (glutamine-hydrolysing)